MSHQENKNQDQLPEAWRRRAPDVSSSGNEGKVSVSIAVLATLISLVIYAMALAAFPKVLQNFFDLMWSRKVDPSAAFGTLLFTEVLIIVDLVLCCVGLALGIKGARGWDQSDVRTAAAGIGFNLAGFLILLSLAVVFGILVVIHI